MTQKEMSADAKARRDESLNVSLQDKTTFENVGVPIYRAGYTKGWEDGRSAGFDEGNQSFNTGRRVLTLMVLVVFSFCVGAIAQGYFSSIQMYQ